MTHSIQHLTNGIKVNSWTNYPRAFALNHKALKLSVNEVNWAVQQSRGSHNAQLSGTQNCGDIHAMLGRGIRGWGFAQTRFVWEGMPLFLPADSLCKAEEAEQKSGSTLTTHHFILDFWRVPHGLINSRVLEQHTRDFKWDQRKQRLSSLNCHKQLEFYGPKLKSGLVLGVEKLISANLASKQLPEMSQKGHKLMKDMLLISYHLLSLCVVPSVGQILWLNTTICHEEKQEEHFQYAQSSVSISCQT